jgi:membrane protein
MCIKKIAHCLYQALVDTVNHDGIEHAGYMAFLALLSLFPFLVFFIAIVGFIGESSLGTEFVSLLLSNLPKRVAEALSPRIQEIISGPPQGLLTLAIVGAIWTASSSVEGLRTILNRAYRVSAPPAYLWRRFLSIVQFLIITAILIIAMTVLVFLPLVLEKFADILHIGQLFDPLWVYLRYTLISAALFLGVSTLYYTLPNIRLSWRNVMPGAGLVMVLWVLSGILFSSYLSHFQQVNLIYGSLGGIIVALLFFYIVNVIFILGAEFNFLLEKNLRHSADTPADTMPGGL